MASRSCPDARHLHRDPGDRHAGGALPRCRTLDALTAILKHRGAVVLDGALATALEQRGYDLDDPLWSARILLERPEAIRQLHLDYFRAGADCAITASYQATIEGFRARGLTTAEAAQLIARSVTLARSARDAFWSDAAARAGRARPFIAGSIGPYGAFLADGSEYRGHYGLTERELIEFHRPRMQILVEAGAEMLACETIPSLTEARALAALLPEFPGMRAWLTFSAADDRHVSEGQVFADCVRVLARHPQIAAIGINCTSPRYVTPLIRAAVATTDTPVVVYPNSGEAYDAATRSWHGTTPTTAFADLAREWYDAGARLIGGCCRTTPDDIRALAGWVRTQPHRV